jgi:hypothetical protein
VNHPDWYPDWRHEVVHELHAKNERPDQVYSIKRWPRWDYDPEAGTLTFSEDGIAKVVAEIQVICTRPRDEGGGLYLVYRKVDWVN